MDDNIKKLHQALIDDGYDDVGTEQEFRDYVSDSKNVATLYNALSEAGYDNFKDQKSLETYLSAKAPVAQKPSTPQSSGQSVSSKEKKQSQYPQEVIDAFNSPDNKPGNFKDLAQLNDEYQRGELKKPSLILQALGMMPKVDAGNIGREQKMGGMITNMLLGDNMQQPQKTQQPLPSNTPSQEPSQFVQMLAEQQQNQTLPQTKVQQQAQNEGLLDAKLANYLENWKQRPNKEGDYFENMVADLLADGTANSNEEAVSIVKSALGRYANRLAMDVTNQVVSSLPDDTVQDAEQSIEAQWYSHGVQDKLKQEADNMGISYDDYVGLFLKPAMVQSLVNKYGLNYRNIAEGIATRLYAHDEHVQDRLMNQDINDALTSVIKKYVDSSVVDEYNKAQEVGSKAFTEGMEGSQFIPANLRLGTALGAQYEANKAKDPAKVLSGLQKKFSRLYRNPEFLNDMSNAAFKVMQRYGLNGTQSSDPKQFKPMINSVLKNELDQLEIKGMMPKGSAEYIMKTGLGNTIVGKIIRKAVQTDYQNWLEDMANQQYQPGFWENVASGALTFAGDAWSYWLPGAAGGKLTKSMLAKAEGRLAGDLMAKGMESRMAARAAKLLIGKSKTEALKSGAVHGAVTFGGQSAISKPIDEKYRTGQFDENGKIYNPSGWKIALDTLLEGGKQSALGVIMQGNTIANMIGKGRGLATNILADIGGKVADSGIMTGHQMLERMAHDPNFKPTGKDAAESFLESMANLTAIGLPGMVGKYARFKDAREFNKKFDFTDQDIAELKRFGYDGLRDAFEKVGIGEYAVEGENAQRLDGQLTQKYMDLMNDKSVPEVLKAKMMSVVEGKRPSSFSPIVDSIIVQPMDHDGKVYLETLNKDGGIIDRQEYSSLAEAQKADKKLEYEKTLGLASVLEGEFHNEFTQEHLDGLYNQAAQKYNMGEKLTDEDKAAVYLHQNAGAIKDIMDKQQKGIILTEEEQNQVDTYRHFYNSALENSSVMREFVNTFEDSHGVARGTLRKALESKDKKYAPLVESYLKELYNSIELKREMKLTMDDLYNTAHGNEQKRIEQSGIEGEKPAAPVEGAASVEGAAPVEGTSSVEGAAGGQEPSASEGPAPYQDRTNSVPSPSDANSAANVANSSAEVAASDAFVMGQNAYKNGDSGTLKAIDYNSDLATGRLKRAFADSDTMFDLVTKAYNEGRDMEQFVAQRAGNLTPAQKEAISKYVEAMDAKKGAIDALQHADDGYGEALKQQLWPYQTEDGNIVPATLTSGKQVFLKKANEYGGGFVVVPDEQGQPTIKQVSNAEIKEVGTPVSLDEYIESSLAQQKEARAQQFISQFDGSGLKPNDRVAVAMEEGDANIVMVFAGFSEDGKIVLTDGKDNIALTKEEFDTWRKNALDNTINERLDREDGEREMAELKQAEADKQERYKKGIFGYAAGQPDYSDTQTDPKVAAEYLQETAGEDRKALFANIVAEKQALQKRINQLRDHIASNEEWLSINADLDPKNAETRTLANKQMEGQIADLQARFDNWNKIRSAVMTPEEAQAIKADRTQKIADAGVNEGDVAPIEGREVAVLSDEELKKQYPTMDEASDFITSERKRIYRIQSDEVQREIDGVDEVLDRFVNGEIDLEPEQIKELNTTKAQLQARQANLTESAKELKAQADKLKTLYRKENMEARAKAVEDMTPAEQRAIKVENAIKNGNMSQLNSIYDDVRGATDFNDTEPNTLEEYVANNIGRFTLNYEGKEKGGAFSNGIQQETGLGRKDFEKLQILAKEGEGKTVPEFVHSLYDDMPMNLKQMGYTDHDIRSAFLDLIGSAQSYSDIKNYTLNNKVTNVEQLMRDVERQEEEMKENGTHSEASFGERLIFKIPSPESKMVDSGNGTAKLVSINNVESSGVKVRKPESQDIVGLERHPRQEIADVIANYFIDKLADEGIKVSIEGLDFLGSRVRHTAWPDDDLDVVIEYKGLYPEQIVSKIFEQGEAKLEDIDIHIIPIHEQESGSLKEYVKKAQELDDEYMKNFGFTTRLEYEKRKIADDISEAQKKAGNYKKGHLSFGGYDYTVETPKGVTRSGKDEQGKPWSVTMHDTYGYILGKIGVDGDHIDMFINDAADLDTFDGNVYVVDQLNPETGEFDEHKVMYGYPSEEAATEAYLANYSKGWKGLGKVTSVPKATFDKWLESSDRKTKPFAEYAMVQKEQRAAYNSGNLQENSEKTSENLPSFGKRNDIQKDNPILREARKKISDTLDELDKFRADEQSFFKKIKAIFKSKPEKDAIVEARELIAKRRNKYPGVFDINGFDYNKKYDGANLPGVVYGIYEKAYNKISGVEHKIEHVSGTGFLNTISDSEALENYINGIYAMFIGGKLGAKFYLEDNLPEISKQVYKIASNDIKLGRVLSREGVNYYDPNLRFADPALFDDPFVPNELFSGWLEKPNQKKHETLPFDAPMNMDDLPFHRDVKEVKPSEMTEAQKVAYDAVSTMLKKAGIPVKVVSNEDMEKVAEAQDNLNLAMLLNQPEMRFKIKTPEEKQAAENAYNFAKDLRPNKWAQYAVVDMSNPNKMPEYYQKQELARKERTYLNRLMWGNYKVFNLDKSFEDNVAGLTGSFPSEFDPYKIDEQTSKKNELKKQIKETEEAYKLIGQERKEYQNQLMKEYMDEHGLASENDIPDDVWREFDYKAIEKYQDKLDSLFAKYKDLDRQLKAIVQPGVRFLRTYHGTGASFDKFDLSHALEGEGSESFGHGVYVTNSSKIGREYAQRAKQRKMEDLYKNMRYPDGVKGDIFKRRVFGEMVNDVATGGSVASAKEFAKKRVGADVNDIQRTLENLKDREKGTEYEQNLKNRLAEYKEGLKWIDSLDEDYLTQGNANRYDVDIPDDNGSNYLDWEGTIPDSLDKQKVAEDAYKVVSDNQGFNDFKATPLNDFIAHTLKTYVNTTDVAGRVEKLKSDIKDVIENYVADDDVLALNEYLKDATPDDVLATIWYNDLVRDIKDADLGEELYRKLSTYVGDNAASQILSDNGFVGIKYPAGMIHGGAKEGDYNYVIFDENNANIVGNTKFAQGKGVVYGYTDGKEIVLNQEHLNPNTPIHEYQHLWRTAAKEMNPELIAHGDELIKQTQLFADLKEDPNYKHLSDDEICDEAFARLTGEDGAAILEQMAKEAIKENPLDTAKELTIINRLKNWLKKFWYWTLDTFTKWKPEDIKKMTLEDIRNLVLRDLAESKVLWNRFRGDSNSLGENQGSALTPSANNPSGKDSVLNPHSDAKIRNNIETAKGNGGNLSVEDKIKAVSQQFGVDEADVAMYANAIKKGSTAEAARARANIKRHLLQANEDKISSFKELLKYTKPVNEALKENFGDVDAMIEERKQQVEAQRNAMEAARKRAEEEETKRQKHLEELSLIPDDQLDKQYMDALAKGDDATAREMLDESARRKGYDDTESSYQGVGAWKAPGNPGYESDKARRDDWESSGSDVNLEDMALGYTPQPDDYFSHPERYSQNTPHGLESVKAINEAIDAIKNGEKDVKVKVYRAVPTSVKEGKLRNGDWVTPSKKYAEMHGTNRLEGKYRIIEDEVPATQLWWDGNDANEFGFDDGKAYKYKNAKNNRKLNDLVTYDDEGDVIPPSKRFNSRKSDIRFMFAGEKGAVEADKADEQTIRMDNLDVAKQMEDEKKDAKAIKMATGWEKGVDGKWRYEMPDAKIKDTIDVGGGNIVKRFEEDMLWTDGKLEDAVDAPKLFEAYPQLKNIKIHTDAVMNDMPSNGEYNPQTKTITIHADELKYLNSILNHEIQHVIQREEGFAHGGTPEQVERDFNAAKAEWKARSYAFELEEKAKEMGGEYNQSAVEKALIQKYKDMDMPEFIPDKETRIKGFNYFARGYADRSMDDAIKRFRLDRFQRTDFDSYQEYRKLAGEVESRNVEKRLGMTDEERRNSLASETEDVNRDEQIVMNGNDASYSIVKDPETIKKLDKEDTVKVYRAMQVGEDGKLYPPMAAKVKGKFVEPIELGKWEQADERPELADDKGMFTLNKGNGKSLKAAYNPYLHTSRTPLNDQFSEAQNRPNIVTVEVEVPKSELTSGYKADKAKDAVGEVEWKAGIIQGQLTGKRKVVLSRWDKPVRIVPDSEVADVIVNDMFKDKNITMPSNVVTPSLRKELEKRGVPFVETDNRGRIVGGENDGVHYSKVYGKNHREKGYRSILKFSLGDNGTDVADGNGDSINQNPNKNVITRKIGSRAQAQRRVNETLGAAADNFRRNQTATAEKQQGTWDRGPVLGYVIRAAKKNLSFIPDEELKKIVGDSIGHGEENFVYHAKYDDTKVIKLNDFTMTDSLFRINEFIDRINAHNQFMPEDKYTPLGFAYNQKGDPCIVMEQPYLKGTTPTREEITQYLTDHGFKLDMIQISADEVDLGWTNGEFDLWDAEPRNVIKDENGDLHFFDTMIQHTYIPNHKNPLRLSMPSIRTFESQEMKDSADKVKNVANVLGGAEVTSYTNASEVPDEYKEAVEQGARGWYDPGTHTVHVYLPNCADADEAQRTVFHEKIGHEGMEVLLGGEQGVRKFADFVYKSVDKKTRGKILDFAHQYDPGWNNPDRINIGTQEYIAHLAEEGPTTAEDFSLWTKIKHYLIKVLKKLGIRVPGLLNDKDLRYYLMKAGKALHVWDNMPKEKQEAMMAQASNAEIKDALADGAGKGKPRQKKGESTIQYMKRVMEWKRWKEAREDKEDPEPPMFYDFDKDAEGKKEWERLIKENPMADMFAFEKQKQDEARQKYEDWLTRHELNEQNDADLDLYEGKIYPAETNPEADALEQEVMQDLAEVTSTDVSKEGAATTVKHAVIHRRKNMEEASADDAIYINDVKNSIEKMAESGAFDKLLSDYQGKPNKAEKLAEAIPYIIEAPRRIREIAYKLNSTGVFGEGHIHITPDDVEAVQELRPQLAEVTAKKHTELKDGKEVELFDDMKGATEVASKVADIINGNHEKEPGFVPIDGTDILNKNVLPIILNSITPYGVDYKNLSEPMKSVLDAIRDWYNYTFDWLKDNNTLKADTGFTVDYVNHLWDKEKSDKQAYAMYVENRQRTKSPNEKPRQINTIMEGLEVGLVPKTTDITKMMAYYSRSNIEAWANKTMLQEVSGLNVIERNEDGEIISSDPLLSSVAPFNLEQYKYFEIPGVGPVWVYNVSPKQMKVKNPITGKEKVLYSEASAGDRFGVVFETYQSSPFWKAFDTAASSAKKLELGFSGFHAGALTEVYMVQNMTEFGPKKALANFMKYIFVDTMKNHQLPCFANPQDFQEAATHLVKFGATNDYAAADVQNMFDNWRDFAQKLQQKLEERGKIGMAVGTATIPFEVATQMVSMLNKGMDVALWDFLHDGLKLATYRMRADRTKERAKKYGWTDEQLGKALDEDGQFVNDMFGGQHWDVLGASHRTLRYAGRVLLSPDWNASTTRHFLALTGFGSVWNEATFENFKNYYKNVWGATRGKGKLTPDDWGRLSRQLSALLCYGIGFMIFYEGFANAFNAAFRALDEEKERKKAEELRKTNPNYRSPYELAYPDGMKWYDYLMRGNSLGQQSKIFMGRYADGTEMYIRHGKQFREVPEYLFNHKGELEFPGPMVQRMIGKANPMVRMTLDDINYLSDFQASHADQEIQRKYGKAIGLLYKDALYWAPFLIPSQENKEFKAVDFFFPSSKGFSPWKAQGYFKDFILSGDMEGVVMTYQSCERNGIDAEAQIKAAIGSVKALESAEMKDGITSLQVASERFDEAKSITEKKKMRQKMKKFLSQSEYKAFTQKEALDMVQSYLNGEDDLKEMEKAENKYLMKAKSEDVTEDWRIQAVWNGTMETYDEYQRLKDVDKAKANAFKNSKTNKRLFAARKAISAAKKKMNKAKKQMDGQNDAAKMVEIRKTRKELIETLNGME